MDGPPYHGFEAQNPAKASNVGKLSMPTNEF